MVFRQLRIAGPAILALALAGSACGNGSESSVSVAMRLDGASCGAAPNQLMLTCGSTAIVHVRDIDDDLVASDCVHLDSGRLTDMADDLGGLVDLGSLPASTPLTIELAIHSGVLEPCPITRQPEGAFLFGSTLRVTLDELSSDLILPMQCIFNEGGVPVGGFCDQCDSSLNECLQRGGLTSCDSLFTDCQQDCGINGNEIGCFDACMALTSLCSEGPDGISLSCFAQGECSATCGDQDPTCLQACFDAEQKCSVYAAELSQCFSEHEFCLDGCSGSASCLGFDDFQPGF